MTPISLPERHELAGDDFFQDPYPYYKRLLRHDGPFWLSHVQEISSSGILLFSRYRHATEIFTRIQGISKNIRSVRPVGKESSFDMHLLHRDGPDHLRLRRLVSEWFSVQAVDHLRPTMRDVARKQLESLLHKSEFDLVAEFAEPLPLNIIARLVGVPEEDMPQIRSWSLALGDGFDSLLVDATILKRQKHAMDEFLSYIVQQIEARRAQPDSSLLGFLVSSGAEHTSDEELIAMVGFLLFAGHETTVSLIGSAVWLLLSHPQQWALLREHPELVPGAVEEVLRFESPEQRSSFRLLNEPWTIDGHRLEPGQQIGVIIGSANRDEAVFERPDDFDIRRASNRHLAFGAGLHNCLGKTLARVETQVALQVFLEYLPDLVLLEQNPRWRKNSFFRGLSSLRLAPHRVE